MAVLAVDSLPLGFRFHPSDQELVNHYLKRKINGRINSDAVVVIPEVDVCKCEPWDLPGKSVIRSVDPEWFFFSPLDRKYTIGARQNRLTEAGFWKATGNDRKIKSRSGRQAAVIGLKKTLVFHLGRAPHGRRTCWIMHEYRTTEPEFDSGEKGQFVLCRLFKKPEGSNASPNADEVEIFPDTEHEAVALEDFAAPLNKELSEKNLQDNSQPLPVTADNQPVRDQKWMNDEAEYSTAYLSKPEDNHCNRNMTSAETFGDEAGLLQGDLAWFSASDFDQLGSGAVSPLPDMDFQFDDRFNQGFSREPLQDADADKDSLDEFLEAMLSNQEDSGTSRDIDTRPISYIVQHQASSKLTGGGSSLEAAAHQVLQMASSKLTGGGSSPMAIAHQGFSMESLQDADADKDLLDESLEAMLSYQEDDFAELLYSGTSSNIDTRLEAQAGMLLNDSRQVKMFHMASPQESIGQSFSSVNLSEFTRSSNDSFSTMEESTAQTYFTSSGIRIRNRQVDSSSNSIKEEQGLAIRRIRLQNSSRKSHVSTIELQMSNEVGEYSQHQIAEGGEDSGPHHGDKPSVRSSVRLRKKSTKDTGDELEGKPLHPQVIRPGSVYIITIVVIILVFLLLLCVWNMVPIKFMPYL